MHWFPLVLAPRGQLPMQYALRAFFLTGWPPAQLSRSRPSVAGCSHRQPVLVKPRGHVPLSHPILGLPKLLKNSPALVTSQDLLVFLYPLGHFTICAVRRMFRP